MADDIERWVAANQLDVTVERVVCLAHCQDGPSTRLIPGDFVLGATTEMLKTRLLAEASTRKS